MSTMMTQPKPLCVLADVLSAWYKADGIEPTFAIPFSHCNLPAEAFSEEGHLSGASMYRALRKLNEDAMLSRYPSSGCEDEYVPYESSGADPNDLSRENLLKLHRLLSFYRYQCDEDGTCESDLFKAVTCLRDSMAHYLLSQEEDALGLGWGEWR